VRDTPDADKRARLEVRDLDEAWETPVTSVAGVSVRPLLVIPACVGMCVRIFRVYVERIRDCTTLQTINRAFNNGVGFSSHNCCASHPCSRRWVGPRRQSVPRTPLAALRSFLNGSRLNGKVAHSKAVHVARGGVVMAAQLSRLCTLRALWFFLCKATPQALARRAASGARAWRAVDGKKPPTLLLVG
jgi:hypothetical protein